MWVIFINVHLCREWAVGADGSRGTSLGEQYWKKGDGVVGFCKRIKVHVDQEVQGGEKGS